MCECATVAAPAAGLTFWMADANLLARFDGGQVTSAGGLRPGVAAGAGPPRPGGAGSPAGVPDRLRVRGPGRRRRAALGPALEAGLRAAAGQRARPGQPADALAPGERRRPACRRAP